MNEEIEHDISAWSQEKRVSFAYHLMTRLLYQLKIRPFKEFGYTRDGKAELGITIISYIKKQR